MTKKLVISLDAATWRVMKPLMQEERLPNIQRLINEGTSGILYSTIPPFTPSAWTSIVTGVNPGKHGFFDFVAQDHETYRVEYVNCSRLIRPAIWDMFNTYGKKVGVVNFPMAFPPPHVDSFFISGFPTQKAKIMSIHINSINFCAGGNTEFTRAGNYGMERKGTSMR